jgi:hypothetical protein
VAGVSRRDSRVTGAAALLGLAGLLIGALASATALKIVGLCLFGGSGVLFTIQWQRQRDARRRS